MKLTDRAKRALDSASPVAKAFIPAEVLSLILDLVREVDAQRARLDNIERAQKAEHDQELRTEVHRAER